jgi:hypothetical protein
MSFYFRADLEIAIKRIERLQRIDVLMAGFSPAPKQGVTLLIFRPSFHRIKNL